MNTARCDGDQLAVGACGSGFNNDCPGGTFTLMECCRVPEFYYGTCEVRGGTWGELLACPDIHTGDGHLLEGLCESGSNYDCNGHASEVECCQGHYQGQVVGSTGQCSWLFSGGFGTTLGTAFITEMDNSLVSTPVVPSVFPPSLTCGVLQSAGGLTRL